VVRAGAKRLALLAALALALPAAAPAPAAAEGAPYLRADKVLVIKSDRRLRLMRGRAVLYEFPISLGWNPVGHKLYEGDGRTPEGRYTLDYFNTQSAFYRSIHISYPNGVDRSRGAATASAATSSFTACPTARRGLASSRPERTGRQAALRLAMTRWT
jgi:hypothetical protein